jgi:hypothetical protein
MSKILASVLSTDYVLTPVLAVERNINTWGVTQGEQQHPRCCFYPRRNLARPRTATRAKGPPPKGGR